MNISKINTLHKEVQSGVSFKDTLIAICDFVAMLESSSDRDKLIQQIEHKRIEDHAELKAFEDSLNEEVYTALKEIDQYCVDNKIKQRGVHESFFDLSWQSNEPEEHRKYMFLQSEFVWLVETYPESINFVSKFSYVSCAVDAEKKTPYYDAQTGCAACAIPKPDIYLKCAQSYIAWYGSKERLEVKAPGTVWHSWDNIKFVYDLKNNVYDLRVSLANQGRHIDVGIAAEAFQQFKRIIQGEDRSNAIIGLTLESLKRDVRVIHNFFEDVVQIKESVLPSSDKKALLSYDQDTGLITWTKEQIGVYGEDIQGQILSLFFPNGSPVKDKLSIDEIHDDIGSPHEVGKKLSKVEKDKIGSAVRRINNEKFIPIYGIKLILRKNNNFFLNPVVFDC